MGEAMEVTTAPTTLGPRAVEPPRLVALDRGEWESAVRRFGDYGYRQSWAYGVALANKRGATSEHVGIRSGAELVGLADVRVKDLPIVGGGLAYVSGGPLVRMGHDADSDLERLELCVDALVDEFVQRRGLTLRVLAPVGSAEWNLSVANRLERANLRRTDRGENYRTILLDIDRPPEQIRSSFHRHWRRHLNGAERNDLAVSFGTGPGRFESVQRMSDALRARKNYELDLDANFFADVEADLEARDRLVVGLVSQAGTPVAGSITAIHGDTAVYLVGASTRAGRDCKASYLMHWRTIELARARGVRWYDLGGIDPVANPGVSSFKLRTNGFDVTAAGPFEMPASGVRGRLGDWAERAYLRTRRSGGA